MKPFIEKIFYVHDSQLSKKSNTYSNYLGLFFGILAIILSPLTIYYGNNITHEIIEKRTQTHVYFIKKIDKKLDIISNTKKENCMIDELIRTTDIDNDLTKKIPLLFAIVFLLMGYLSIQTSLLSLKLKNKTDTD